jgi:hypothetical protein
MNVGLHCIDRWDKWEKFEAIAACKKFLETKEVPVEFNYIISECVIGDLIYECSECEFCPYSIPNDYGCDCWGLYGQVLK